MMHTQPDLHASRRTPSNVSTPLAVGAAVLADHLIADPIRLHPVRAFGTLAALMERRLWRPSRFAGAVYTALLVGGMSGLTSVAQRRIHSNEVRVVFATVILWVALGGRSLFSEARRVAAALRHEDLVEARRRLPSLCGRDPRDLDATELCRAAIESVAENTADAVTGPLVWAVVVGPAGVATYRAANTLDAMVGHRDERYERFGWAAARTDDVLTWLPARLAAALTCLLAPLAGGETRRAWMTWRRDGAKHPSPNAGQLEAAFAGALGVCLGGRNRYGTQVENRPAIGGGDRPRPDHVERAAELSAAVGWASALVCALVALGWQGARKAGGTA